MKIYKNKTNSFEKINVVYEPNIELKEYANNEIIYQTNNICSIKEMFLETQNLINETKRNYKERENGKTYKHRFGISIEILLPLHIKEESYQPIAKNICDYLTKDKAFPIPIYVCLVEKGTALFLHFMIFERVLYQELTEIKTYVSKDIYKNKQTKRFCKADNPDAVIHKKKGELLSSHYSFFSNKIDWFFFSNGSKNLFKTFKTNFNLFLLDTYSKHGEPMIESYFIQKIDTNKLPQSTKNMIKTFNAFLKKIEDSVLSIEEGLAVLPIDKKENVHYFTLCEYLDTELVYFIERINNGKRMRANEIIQLTSEFILNNEEIIYNKIKEYEQLIFESFSDNGY